MGGKWSVVAKNRILPYSVCCGLRTGLPHIEPGEPKLNLVYLYLADIGEVENCGLEGSK